MKARRNALYGQRYVGLLMIWALASAVQANESCLQGLWEVEEERGQLLRARGEQDTLQMTGKLTLELGQAPAADAPKQGWKRLRLAYQDYEARSQRWAGKMRSDRLVRFQGTSEGMWRLDEKRQHIILKPKERILMAAFFKAEIPEKNTDNPWRKMGEGPVSAPHRNEFSYTCTGGTLTLKKDAVSGLDAGYYEGRFQRK